jgi:hypothetical protein
MDSIRKEVERQIDTYTVKSYTNKHTHKRRSSLYSLIEKKDSLTKKSWAEKVTTYIGVAKSDNYTQRIFEAFGTLNTDSVRDLWEKSQFRNSSLNNTAE